MHAPRDRRWFTLGAAAILMVLTACSSQVSEALPPPPDTPAEPAEAAATPRAAVPAHQVATASAARAAVSRPPSGCTTPLPEGDEWTTYHAPDNSLTFEYPANWQVADESAAANWGKVVSSVVIRNTSAECPSGTALGRDIFRLKFGVDPGGLNGGTRLEDLFDGPGRDPSRQLIGRTELNIQGQRALHVIEKYQSLPVENGQLVFLKDSRLYVISEYFLTPAYKPVFARVAASIRFP